MKIWYLNIKMQHINFIDEQLLEVEKMIDEILQDKQEEVEILDSIPGINKRGASVIIAEIGTDMKQFPSSSAISSWAGISPGNNESAGKKKKSHIACR